MVRTYLFCFSLLCAVISGRAFAEGNCPAGMYPIGGQGVMGCAPIPTSSNPPQTTPQIIWVEKWGALAADIGVIGISTDFSNEAGAVHAALQQCKARGGKNCKLATAYRNTCIAAAIPSRDGVPLKGRFAIETGPNLSAIQVGVVELCEEDNGTSCEVAYTDCALP